MILPESILKNQEKKLKKITKEKKQKNQEQTVITDKNTSTNLEKHEETRRIKKK